MVNERDADTIERAHIAAERLEKANADKETLIKKEIEIEQRAEARRLLSGDSLAGEQLKSRELPPEEKLKIDTRNYFKGTAIEQALK